MFRRPRSTEPDPVALLLGRALKPVPAMLWGGQAMCFLGVPMVLGVCRTFRYPFARLPGTDEGNVPIFIRSSQLSFKMRIIKSQYRNCTTQDFSFRNRDANRPQRSWKLSDPQGVIDEINAGYRRVDQAATTFDFPEDSRIKEQLTLLPNSFVHLPPINNPRYSKEYVSFDNLWYPCERALVSSFVQATIDDENVNKFSNWVDVLRSWIAFMVGYLDVNNDIFDDWEFIDSRAKEWYSKEFGKAREEKYGPWDRRISKRIGSSKEMSVDARGNPLQPTGTKAINNPNST